MPSYKNILKKIAANLKFSAPTLLNSAETSLRFFIANELFRDLPNEVILLDSYNLISTAEMLAIIPLTAPIDLMGVIMGKVVGEKNLVEINDKYSSLRQISFLLSIAPSLIMPFALPPLFEVFSVSSDMVEIAKQYFLWRGSTFFLEALTNGQRVIAIALDNQWHTVLSMLTGLAVFAGSGYLFRESDLDLNCAIVALGLACNHFFQVSYYELYHRLNSKNNISNFLKFNLSELKNTAKELFHLSWAVVISNTIYFGSYLGRTFVLKIVGDTAVLVDALSSTFTEFLFSLSGGFNRLNSITTAKAVGENKLINVASDLKHSLATVLTINSFWMLTLPIISGDRFANVVLDDPLLSEEIGGELKMYMIYSSLAHVFDAVCMCFVGVLNGLEDTKATSIIDGITSVLSIILPIVLVNFTGLGEDGVPIGLFIANFLGAALYTGRYFNSHAKRISNSSAPSVEEVPYDTIPEVQTEAVRVANHPQTFFADENTRLITQDPLISSAI